jgi:hypothetical protein
MLSDPDMALRDEVIITCIPLGIIENVNKVDESAMPFNSPLADMNMLDIYGANQIVPEHMNALYRLVAMKGGLETMKLPAANEMIIL